MIQQMLAIWSLVPLPFPNPVLYIWKFLVHVLLKPSLKDFEHNLASMWNECNCMVIWTFFSIAFLWDWTENWLAFSSPVATSEFSTVYCDPHKGFGRVNKAKIDVFLEFSCFFNDPVGVGNLISASSAFSKTSLNLWKFMVHILLKPSLKDFEHNLASMWNECNCMVIWTFFGIAFLWDWNENRPFPVLWPLLSFPNLLAY